MPRGRKVSPEQIVVMLRQIEVQLAQGMSLALACKEAEISEQTRDRSLARPLQSGAAAFILGLPTARPVTVADIHRPLSRGAAMH